MAITFTVGTSSRNYSTLQAAWNATASSWTDDYIFELYNDSEFTAGMVASGKTTGSFTLTVRPATGQGFRDHASKATNALRYNQSNGVAISKNGFLEGIFDIQQALTFTLDGLQIVNTSSGGFGVNFASGTSTPTIKNCIIQTAGTLIADMSNMNAGSGFLNNVCIVTSNTANAVRIAAQVARGNTIVYIGSGSSSGTGLQANWVAATSNSNAVFGFTTAHGTNNGGSWSGSSGNNATDLSSTGAGGSGNVTSATFANQFEAVGTAGSEDLRLKSGNSLAGAGSYNASIDPDILSQTRANPPAIGAVEPIASTPNAPSGVTGGSITATSATCSWTDNSSDETSFDVQYSPSPYSSWTTLSGSPTAANATSLATGSILTDGTSYKFRVRATSGSGSSGWVESGVFTTSTLTKLRPNADTTVSGWTASTGSSLYAMIDESSTDDGDYVTINTTGTYKFKLQSSSTPAADTDHKLKIRARKSSGTLTLQLVQGDPSETTIASTAIAASASFAEYALTITEGEAATITDYGALYGKVRSS